MAGSIAKAYVQIIPSADGIKGKLTNLFNGEMPAAGKSAGGLFGSNLIGKIKGLVAAAGIGKAIADAIMTGSELEQLKGGVQKIFDEMDTSTIMADAANAYKDLNMSANQYLATINDVGASFAATMGDQKGYAVAKTGLQAISDYASGTGKNVSELSQKFTMITRSTSSYQSIADQFSGILPATSAGFLEQAQAAGLLSSKYKKLTAVPIDEYQQAVAEMLRIGTEELGLAGNTAEETATTFAGSFAAMKAAYSNFIGALATGEDIGPALNVLGETIFTFITGNLMPMIGNILSELPTVLSSAFGMAIQSMNIAADNADALLQQGSDLVIGIGTAIISALPYLADAAINLVAAIGKALVSTDWTKIGRDTINCLRSSLDLAAGEILGTDGNIVKSVLNAITSGLPSFLESGISIVTEIANGILEAIPDLLLIAGDLVSQLYDAILSMIPILQASGVELVNQLVSGITSNLPAIVESAANILAQLLATIASHLPELLETGFSLSGQLAAGLIQAIPSVVASIPKIIQSIVSAFTQWNWGDIGINIARGIANGIASGASAIVQAAKNAASSALRSAKVFLGIASPSKVMRDQVGKFIPEGVAVGIESNTKPLTDAMHDLSDLTTSTINADLNLDHAAVSTEPAAYRYGDNNVSINVYASENQDVDELAEILMSKIQFAISCREVSFAR